MIPYRSALYLPGANARALDKARHLPADALILDLEDAVAPDAKAIARAQVVAALKQGGFGHRQLIVRVNGLDTPWGNEDVAAIARLPCHAVLFPKVSAASDVLAAVAALDEVGAPYERPVWIMAETARCIAHINDISEAHRRLRGIVVGTSDLAKETRVRHTRDRLGLLTALNLCVYAARARQLVVLDGVHLQLDDEEGLRAACDQGRDLGFDGKTLIHPKQIAAANAAFAPTLADVANAREIIAAYDQAKAAGLGVVVVQGRLVEQLHVDDAHRVLALDAAIRQHADSGA